MTNLLLAIIVVLLGIDKIFGFWTRLLFWLAPSQFIKRASGKKARRMYFIREYELAHTQLWKAKFFKKQKKELREEIRRQYDKATETLDAAKGRIEAERKKEDPDKTIMESMQKQIDLRAKEIDQFKQQIDHIDSEVKGFEEAIDSLYTVFPSLEEEVKK